MTKVTPLLTIGLPVYNGQRYVKEALDSVLLQDFTDFEVVISDNASTDSTGDICRAYEKKDGRVRYYRNPRNLGAAGNFNNVLNLSRGRKYFKWIACDDVYGQGYLRKCVSVLEGDASVAVSYPRTKRIDEHGNVTGDYVLELDSANEDPALRFREFTLKEHACFQIFGVMRKDVLLKTGRFGNYSGADRVLISELALHGKLFEVPERLFLRRSHPHESRMLFPDRNIRVAWFDPSRAGKIVFSEWRLLKEYWRAVDRSPITLPERLRCYAAIGALFRMNSRALGHDLKSALAQALGVNSLRGRRRPRRP